MSKIGLIIFIAFIVIQAVVAIVEKAKKEKQQQRMRELAQQQRSGANEGAGARRSAPIARSPSPTQPTPMQRGGPSPDDLAARRKAQLEELRRRRTVQTKTPRSAPIPAQISRGPGPVPIPTTSRAPGPAKKQKRIRALDAGYTSMRQSEQAEAQRRAEEMRRHLEIEDARARREAEEQRRRAERERREKAAEQQLVMRQQRPKAAASAGPIGGELEDAYARRKRGSAVSRRYARIMHSHASLRDALVLKELLDPPISLRDAEPRNF